MSLRDYILRDVTSETATTEYFLGEEQKNQLFAAEYRVASSAPVLVTPIFRGNRIATGDLPLDQESTKDIGAGHIGFQYRLLDASSGPSILEVQVRDA